MIEQADTLVRLITIGASLMLLALLVEGRIRRGLKVTLVGLLVGAVAYLINSSDALTPVGPADRWLELFALSPPFWSWIFGRRLFEREPPPRAVQAAVAALVGAWFFGNFVPGLGIYAFYTIHLISLALIGDFVRVAFADRADDLIEKRRIIRLVLPLLISAQAGFILIYEIALGMAVAIPLVQLVNAVLILVITLFAGLALLQSDPELLLETEHDEPLQQPGGPELSASESVLNDRLAAAMDEGVYRTPGLTIAGLAEHLDTPEHRLRALINRRLGHRNFSAYLNRYRLAEARDKLASREDVDLPILTIAMDLGYNSLPPFNRAFKAETGITPSEFRTQALGSAAGEAEQN